MPKAKKTQRKKHLLAKPGDPLVTAEGKQIMPVSNPVGNNPKTVDVSAANYRPAKKRDKRDLPAPIPTLNGIAAVYLYTMLGLGDREMCEALKITNSQLTEVRNHPVYAEFFDLVQGEMISVSSSKLNSRLAGYAEGAIDTIGTLATGAKHESVRLKAAGDVADRVLGSPKESMQNGARRVQNELRIIITDGRDVESPVSLELNGEDV